MTKIVNPESLMGRYINTLANFLCFFLLLFFHWSSANGISPIINTDSLLIDIRDHNFEKADQNLIEILKKNNLSKVDKQWIEELQYYNAINNEYGIYKNQPLLKKIYLKPLSKEIKAIQLLNQGYYSLLYEIDNDSEAFQKLHQSLKIAEDSNKKILSCEVLKAILIYYIRLFNITDDNWKYYAEVYKKQTYDETESAIQKLLVFFIKTKDEAKISSNEVLEIKKISESSIPQFYQLYAKKQLALYYELYLKDVPKADAYYLASLKSNKKYGADIYFYQAVLSCYGDFLVNQNRNTDAIKYLNRIEEKYQGKTYFNNIVYKYTTISNAYAGLKIYDSAFIYKDKSRILKNKFEQSKHNAIINELNVKEKDQKITSQNKLLMNYEQNKWLYFALIAVVFIIAMYSFVRWKKVDYRRKKLAQEKDSLQVEHSQTIEKLKKVNQLVVHDNIILKNKAKIYLNELQYIKADDHYLNIFTKDGKNHFVRGRLADIIEELPPNFIKCHRSFVVNKNFIKNAQSKFLVMMDNSEVPISRDFKL